MFITIKIKELSVEITKLSFYSLLMTLPFFGRHTSILARGLKSFRNIKVVLK
jgi:hypothetical protein